MPSSCHTSFRHLLIIEAIAKYHSLYVPLNISMYSPDCLLILWLYWILAGNAQISWSTVTTLLVCINQITPLRKYNRIPLFIPLLTPCMFRINNNNQDNTQQCAATTIMSATIIRIITMCACNCKNLIIRSSLLLQLQS